MRYKVVACSKSGHSVVETSKRCYRERERETKETLYSRVLFFCDETRRHTPVRTRSGTMLSARGAVALALVLLVLAGYSGAMPAIDRDKDRFSQNVDLVTDDGSIQKALMNYLFTKSIVKRLRNQQDVEDSQRKRNFWKQCAFNAVACFGK